MRAILTYHSIDRTGSKISVTPEAFRAQMEWLSTEKVPVISLTELLSSSDEGDAIALTFDDALVSVGSEAAPVLEAHGFRATVFVVTRHVGGDNRWLGAGDRDIPVQTVLDWDALARLQARGFTIGAHTRHHRHLPRCSTTELADELEGSADDIAGVLGNRPTTFAYPYGEVDTNVVRAAAAQFAICCSTEFQFVNSETSHEMVPRLDAWYFRNGTRLPRWGSAAFRRMVMVRHARRRIRSVFQ